MTTKNLIALETIQIGAGKEEVVAKNSEFALDVTEADRLIALGAASLAPAPKEKPKAPPKA